MWCTKASSRRRECLLRPSVRNYASSRAGPNNAGLAPLRLIPPWTARAEESTYVSESTCDTLGMAVHHPATIAPTKMELLGAWVPDQPWLGDADVSSLVKVGSYRFDDPDGEVGIETHLLRTADGQVLQVPLTYRGAPRQSAEASLITTMTHTALGNRWIYDACHDPVYVAALVSTIVTGGREADLFMASDEGLVREPVDTHVRGSGAAAAADCAIPSVLAVTHEGTRTHIHAGAPANITVTLLRRPVPQTARSILSGTWPGQSEPLLLAAVQEPS